MFSPKNAAVITALANDGTADDVDAALARYREALARGPADRAVPRDELRVRRAARARPTSSTSRTPAASCAGSSSRR